MMPWKALCASCAAVLLASTIACSKSREDKPRVPAETQTAKAQVATEPSGPEPGGYLPEALGSVNFETTGGTPEARRHFQRGLLALHSFWYEEASDQFEAAIEADPSFDMAYWGLAMSKGKLLWGDDDVRAARAALKRIPHPEKLSPREQEWLMAALALFGKGDVRTTRIAFAATMERLHAKFPDDESATFTAAAYLAAMDNPNNVALRERAAALAQEVFERNPNHPGAAHYIIHAFDTPELAQRALPAAQVYAKIAPEAFHARHMPAHIFARLGRWKEAVTSCESAWEASVAWVKRKQLGAEHHDYHSLTWLVEMNFEIGRRKQSQDALERFAKAVSGGLTHELRALYATQVQSYMERTGEWQRIDELLDPLSAPATDAPTSAAAPAPSAAPTAPIGGASAIACAGHAPSPTDPPVVQFEKRAVLAARARAAAMTHNLKDTQRYLDEKAAVDAEIRPFFVATQPMEMLADNDRLASHVRKALLARARGDDAALLAELGPIAEHEETKYSAEGAGMGNLPREEIADTLLRMKRPKEALVEYEHALRIHPLRASALLGAARSAAQAGDAATSRAYYEKLLAQWDDAEPETPGLAEVQAALAP